MALLRREGAVPWAGSAPGSYSPGSPSWAAEALQCSKQVQQEGEWIAAERTTVSVTPCVWTQHFWGHESLCVMLPAATLAWGQGAPESLLQVWQHGRARQCHQRDVTFLSRQKQERACPCAQGESICHGLASPHISLHQQTVLPLRLKSLKVQC